MPDSMMTAAEAIAAVRRGERCVTEHTIPPDRVKPALYCQHFWRAVACDSVTDVIECHRCGEQQLARCDFDEEYA